jgi:hypothetical protein
MGLEYSFDQDEIWAKAAEAAQREVKKAQSQVAARCRELGIPDRFAPSLSLDWRHRGYDNLLDRRKAELRRMAQTQITAIETRAIVEIETSCLDAQTKLAVAGCTSDAAKAFIDNLPSVERLMQPLSFAEIAGEADPPVAEQLITPNALRQRRFRERQKALRDAALALPPLTVTLQRRQPKLTTGEAQNSRAFEPAERRAGCFAPNCGCPPIRAFAWLRRGPPPAAPWAARARPTRSGLP